MARIMHVDDQPEWISVVQRALAGHQVDSALTYEEAVQLLDGGVPYDLALVDLNLTGQDDRKGRELLSLLMTKFPATRRIVVTASAPVGSMREGIFKQFQLDDMIIKGKATVPGLRMVVERVLQDDIPENPQPAGNHEPETAERDWRDNYRKSELTERFGDWYDDVKEEIRKKINYAENMVRDAGRFGAREVAAAKAILNRWLVMRERFTAACETLRLVIIAAITTDDVLSATQQLEQVVRGIADEMTALQFPGRAR